MSKRYYTNNYIEPDNGVSVTGETSQAEGPYQISCFEGNDGSISIVASGGTEVYSYLWNTGDTVPTITDLSAGTYSVIITDSNGCATDTTFVLDDPEILASGITITNSEEEFNGFGVQCADNENGIIDLEITGGVEPYQYTWSNDEETKTLVT